MKCQSEAGESMWRSWRLNEGPGNRVALRYHNGNAEDGRPRTLSCREWPTDESPQWVKPSRRQLAWPHVTWGKACLTQCNGWNRKGIKVPSICGWVCHPLRELKKSQRIPHYFLLEGCGILEGFLSVDQQNTSQKIKKIFSEMLFDRKLLNLVKKW